MSEQDNIRVVQEMYEAYSRNDIPGVISRMSDDIVFRIPGSRDFPMAGVYRGRSGMNEFFSKLANTIEFSRFEPREYVAQGDRVVALGSYEGKSKGTDRSFSSEWVMVWRIRGGKAVEFQEYTDTEAIANAFRAERRMAV